MKKFIFATNLVLFSIYLPIHAEQLNPYQKGNSLYFTGEGKADPRIRNKEQRKSMAQDAAIINAQGMLAFYIDNLKSENDNLIKQERTGNQKIEKTINLFMKFQNAKVKCDEDDNCTATIKISKKSLLKKLKAHE